MCRRFIGADSRAIVVGKEGRRAEQREKFVIQFQQKPLPIPEGSLELGWPFRYAQNWSNRARTLYKHIDYIDIGQGLTPTGGITLSEAVPFGQALFLDRDSTVSHRQRTLPTTERMFLRPDKKREECSTVYTIVHTFSYSTPLDS